MSKPNAIEVHVSTAITKADLDAAFQFVVKRVRRHGDADPLNGMSAALYAIMWTIGEALTECGLGSAEVSRVIEQTRQQVVGHLAAREKGGAS